MNFRVLSVRATLDALFDMLESEHKVYFARYGDGDFYVMTGSDEMMHKASPALTQELRASFEVKDKRFMKAASLGYPKEDGMAPGMFIEGSLEGGVKLDDFRNRAKMILGKDQDTLDFYNPIVFHYLSVFEPTLLTEFLNRHIRPKKKMFIGSNNVNNMEKLYGHIDYYIETPARDAYDRLDEWWPNVAKHAHDCEVILPSAGMASRAIMDRLWQMNVEAHVLDIGSLNDAIDGKQTRTWIRMAGIETLRTNLTQASVLPPSLEIAQLPYDGIEVVIPHGADNNLGAEYNRIMKNISDWVLFIDHDILLLTRHWYHATLAAIKRHGHDAGWISGVTNRIFCPDQRIAPAVDHDDVIGHIQFANDLYETHGDKTREPTSGIPFSGFFILTHKQAWEKVGGFSNGFLGVDNDYWNKLVGAGYKTYIMPGIYMYHIYRKKELMV